MIGLVSINYKNAPIEVREKFDFSVAQKKDFCKIIKTKRIVEGIMILSTCNRTEIYFENEKFTGLETKIIHKVLKELVDYKSFFDSLSPYVETKTSKYVTEHLFRLVSGLESMIIGEYQIVEQIKESFAFAKSNNMLSPILERMIQKSFEAGKYIRTNTYIDKTLFTKNAARLTLEDGREITISGANNFTYNVGGNITNADKGIDISFSEFAEIFGVSNILYSSSSMNGEISDLYII